MKEHFQDYGVRKWAGDDLIELQSEPLAALQALVSPYAPCIVSGCEVQLNDEGGYTVSAGLVALTGKDVKGNDCVKIVRANGITIDDSNQVCYLTLGHRTLTRTYKDGQSKAIAYDYTAQQSAIKPEDVPYLAITANGGRRLVDTIGITQKLDQEGGEAKDTVVSFVEAATRSKLETNSKLGVLIGQAKKWFSDLRALAFKDKVSKSDLDSALTTELDSKVVNKVGYVLSKNDFTDELKDKLDGIAKNANNFTYSHPTGNGNNHIPSGGESGKYLKWSSSGTATWAKPTASECGAAASSHTHTLTSLGAAASGHSHSAASTSTAGFMSATDKTKLDKIEPISIAISGNALIFTWSATASGTAQTMTYTYKMSSSTSISGGIGTLP